MCVVVVVVVVVVVDAKLPYIFVFWVVVVFTCYIADIFHS